MAQAIGSQTDLGQALAGVRGGVIGPGDVDYDEARKLFNAMIDKRPLLIARCVDVADVIAAVNAARDLGVDVAVRCGAHNGPGLSSVDDGLVIDLSALRGVIVEPDARIAHVLGGTLLGEVVHATQPFGLAAPFGIISTTGVGGLTLGGGVGHMTRKLGLTIDNLVEADVVLADGSFVTANEDQHPDIFWALRGGGGNFGVVTRFAFMSVPPGPPFPEELHLQKVCAVVWCWAGAPGDAVEALAEVRALQPLLDGIQEMPLAVLNSAFDGVYPHGDQWYWRSDVVTEISDEAVAEHARFGEALPTWKSTMHLYPIDGAAARVGADETAWTARNGGWVQVMVGVDPEPANRDLLRDWCVSYWETLHPYSAGGSYVNMMMEEGDDRVRTTYGANYDRLAQIKAEYDPGNLFHVNQNIKPA